MTTGAWREAEKHWSDTSTSHCEVCGRLIPRRSWVFKDADAEIIACSPECEELYYDYLKPTYGQAAAGRGSAAP
jgi:hypothetical protein